MVTLASRKVTANHDVLEDLNKTKVLKITLRKRAKAALNQEKIAEGVENCESSGGTESVAQENPGVKKRKRSQRRKVLVQLTISGKIYFF